MNQEPEQPQPPHPAEFEEVATERELKAFEEENRGSIYKRLWAIKERVFNAHVEAALKETPRCDYRFCRLQKGHLGFHREVDSGKDD